MSAGLAIAADVLVLAWRRRVLQVYAALATLLAVGVVVGTGIAGDEASGFRLVVFGLDTGVGVQAAAEVARPAIVLGLYSQVLVEAGLGFFGVGLGLLATAGAVPSAFAPGRGELLLSRPVGRGQVVLARYAGGLAFAGLLALWTCGLLVGLTGLKHGLWLPRALLIAPALWFKLAILLALASLAGVASRSTLLGLIAAGGAWLVSYVINLARLGTAQRDLPPLIDAPLAWAQQLLPQIGHQNALAKLACQQPLEVPGFSAAAVLLNGAVWIALALALTVALVRRRDAV